jgi:hypothetical protein
MTPKTQRLASVTRRHFLRDCSMGLGSIALSLITENQAALPAPGQSATNPLAPRQPHFAARAKNVIFLHMAGSPPHLDMFDYKPELVTRNGQNCPQQYLQGRRFAFTNGVPKLLGTPHQFRRYGQSGAWVSAACPHIAQIVDELCFVKSLHSDQFNHAPAELLLFSGHNQFGRPSMGTWVTYGLGTVNDNLPGFIVLVSSGVQPSAGNAIWSSGFLPSVYQGVQCRSQGDPVLYVSNPQGMDQDMRRLSLDALNELNGLQADDMGHPETQTRIAQYELAFRMQAAVPEVMDITREPQHILQMYGAQPGASSFANNCLLARRLVEQGVRFVQLHDWGWDFHGTDNGTEINTGLINKCRTMDMPVAALIRDLKARGLLDETLVIWGGEFGRSPFQEGRTANSGRLGRDHHPHCFTMFLAGGGIKAGKTFGSSDEFGFDTGDDAVTPHDLQATILHLLGLNHLQLTHFHQGRDFRLTDVYGNLIEEIVA